MEISVSYANWTTALIEAIENASDGDVILCHTDAMRELGERAKARMCPDKDIAFKVDESNSTGWG